jgi:prevent-host-death family protein
VVYSWPVDVSVSVARARLPDLIRLVEDGDEVTITRHGRPIAVLIHPDALKHRHAGAALDNAARIHEILEGARATALPAPAGLTAERAEELIAEIKAGREAR